MTYKKYETTQASGDKTVWEATDMRMALTLCEQLQGTEPVKIKLVIE